MGYDEQQINQWKKDHKPTKPRRGDCHVGYGTSARIGQGWCPRCGGFMVFSTYIPEYLERRLRHEDGFITHCNHCAARLLVYPVLDAYQYYDYGYPRPGHRLRLIL